MKISDRYVKIVEWSEEDKCYVGTCPTLFYGGCHGMDQAKVYAELCEIVEESIELYKEDGKPLPPPTVRQYSGKFVLRVKQDLHRIIAVRALQSGKSLNGFCQEILEAAVIGPGKVPREKVFSTKRPVSRKRRK
jgi:predicted HicB family RNase H-like nuclease